MKTLKDIKHLEGVKVLLRADFNVPLNNGKVADAYRIQSTLPTIDHLRAKGARIVMVSHLESNDGDNGSLEPIANHLKELGRAVDFVKDIKKAHEKIERLPAGGSILLENLRFFPGEKLNDRKFAKELASLADIYVNDAFSVSHRQHASIVAVTQFLPSYAGLQFEKEVSTLSRAFHPPHPFLFILGGAKFETKLPLLQKFSEIADSVFVAGALANDFFKVMGYEIGTSLISTADFDLSALKNNPKLMVPVDVLDQNNEAKPADGLGKGDKIMDSGPKTVELIGKKIAEAKFILWNGPLGLYEDGYQGATLELAKLVSKATDRGVETIVGGGDTLAAIATLGLLNKFTFISTGGGAMLDFLAKETLPGIEALNKSAE
ncbi:MAG: hypothetical protein QOG91_506 [Candidatus Parcubacteria bacterium]|jgi:3-phosphoglycerate kinase|nr:hypothetical protein [Candidatus Parcubacteria bacterium]